MRAGPFPCVWIEDVCVRRSAAGKGVIRGMMAVCALQPGGVRASGSGLTRNTSGGHRFLLAANRTPADLNMHFLSDLLAGSP